MGSAGNSNYAMAKAAIAALTISIAREMGKYGVTSNFIAPRARTRMTEYDAEQLDVRQAGVGLRRLPPGVAGAARRRSSPARRPPTSTARASSSGAAR